MGFLNNLFGKATDALYAPVAGKTVPLSQVPDPTFAQEMLGRGIAIEPSDGNIYAPCDATVDMMFKTGHAVSLIADFGAEILIHIGLDTVILQGEHFSIHVSNGQKVKRGDLLISFDAEAIKSKGLCILTPMLVYNHSNYTTFKTHIGKTVTNSDAVIELAK